MTIGQQVKLRCMERNIPFLAGIEITNCCNLRCRYCYVKKDEVQQLDISIIKDTLDVLKQMGTRVVVLTGGETFTREDIDDIIREIELRKMFMVIYTNGTIPLKEHYEVLKSKWILRIEITVYGASTETYEHFCGNGNSFQFLNDNLELLSSLNKNILVKIVPTKYNMRDVEEIKQMVGKYGFEINVNTLVVGESDLCRSCILEDDELRKVVHNIKSDNTINTRDVVQNMPTRMCGAGRYSLCIDCRGGIKACFISSDCAGSLLSNDLQKIWKNSEYFLKRRSFQELSVCKKCKKRLFCFACTEVLMAEDSAIKNSSSELCRQANVRKEVFS